MKITIDKAVVEQAIEALSSCDSDGNKYSNHSTQWFNEEEIEEAITALRAALEASKEVEPVSGDTSDGYHTFNELYEHRHALFIKLMRAYPSISWRANNHEDGTMFSGGWFIAGMHLPTGDISYHLPSVYWESLDGVGIATTNRGPKWDGHTAEDVVRRLNGWNNHPAPAIPPGYQLVPKEPTEEMLDSIGVTRSVNRAVWNAMLAAAPEVKK